MLTKQEYIDALLQLGFVRENTSRTNGSHIRFHHGKYPNLFCGITDHKNTKEMSKGVCKDIVKTMATLICLETRDNNNKIDFVKAKILLQRIDEELIGLVVKLLKKADGKDVSVIIPQRLYDEVSKVYDNVTIEEINSYIQ